MENESVVKSDGARAGRELDRLIAQRVMGHVVTQQKREVFEATPRGTRPVARYSTELEAAWEVAERLAITMIPIQGGEWFALVGRGERWSGPAEFMQFLAEADFANAGAAVGRDLPFTICLAALRAMENRELRARGEGRDASPLQ
jgi:hypothetical protein